MDKLNEIIKRCKSSVHIDINDHKSIYLSADVFFENFSQDELEDIHPEILKVMIEKDTIIKCQFYPRTPVGSYDVYHYNLDECLDEVIRILNDVCKE